MARIRTRSAAQTPATVFSTQSKVVLVWMKRTSLLYEALSVNILREVCGFLSLRPLLIRCRERDLLVFDPLESHLRGIDLHCTDYSYSEQLSGECVCIGDGQVFICGGIEFARNRYFVTARTSLITPVQALQLRDMRSARRSHGIYYDDSQRRIYAFGGMLTAYRVSLNCEQYDFRLNSWSELPKMIQKQTRITSCGYQGKVYLSGQSNHCEVYSIAEKQFTLLPIRLLSSLWLSMVAVWRNRLIFVRGSTVQVWDMSSFDLIEEKELIKKVISKSALVSGNTLFYLSTTTCFSLDLETMTFGLTYTLE